MSEKGNIQDSKSHYDWELQYKKKKEEKPLGIPKKEFKDFLEEWKEKNLE